MEKYRKLGWCMLFMEMTVILLVGLAMFFYPEPYSWTNQFLSELGLTRLPDGTSNWISCLLFNTALVCAGIMTAAYFLMRSREFDRPLFRWIMGITGTLGGISLIGIGLPYNLYPELHNGATYLFAAVGASIGMTLFQADTPFGLRAESINWYIFSLFVLTIRECLHHLVYPLKMLPVYPTEPFLQKMVIAFFLYYMIYQTAVLLFRTRNRT